MEPGPSSSASSTAEEGMVLFGGVVLLMIILALIDMIVFPCLNLRQAPRDKPPLWRGSWPQNRTASACARAIPRAPRRGAMDPQGTDPGIPQSGEGQPARASALRR